MASLVGYLEKCLELAREGAAIRLEGDAVEADDEANASDDATPPSVAASSHADEAEIEQARAKLLGFLETTCGAPREVMTRASRDVRITATRRATPTGRCATCNRMPRIIVSFTALAHAFGI